MNSEGILKDTLRLPMQNQRNFIGNLLKEILRTPSNLVTDPAFGAPEFSDLMNVSAFGASALSNLMNASAVGARPPRN